MIYVLFQNLVGGMKKRLHGRLGRTWKTETISPVQKCREITVCSITEVYCYS